MNTSTNPNTVVLNALNRTLKAVEALTDPQEQKRQMNRLIFGAQLDARIIAMFNIWRVQEMISRLKNSIGKVPLENGNISYRFQLPNSYTAFSPYVRVDDLYADFKARMATKPEAERNRELLLEVRATQAPNGELEYHLHSPRTFPLRTDKVTFILNSTETELVEWFPGELPQSFAVKDAAGAHFELGREWVRTGAYNPAKPNNKKQNNNRPANRQPAPLAHVGDALQTALAADIQLENEQDAVAVVAGA